MPRRGLVPRERNPKQLARQQAVWRMAIQERMSTRAIAKELAIHRTTVMDDIKAEAKLRDTERRETREYEKEVQLAKLDDLLTEALLRKDKAGTSALPTAAKVLEMRAKILGLDAPQRVDFVPGRRVLIEVVETTPKPTEQDDAEPIADPS